MGGFGIFCLVILVIIGLYLLSGVLLNYWRGAQGIELIPNLEFWVSLPKKTKEFCAYLGNGCRRSGGYESI